ncbi:MAG TPA: dephospho-CoA kinase [Pseudonocardiaceae bacterium]|nr:dephospho-CoA kinase [Pseudonocardiaceae bacterium]
MLRVGLTGGIGSGKSTVAGRLAEHGATVIDSDRIAREVVARGTEGLAEIVERFGAGMLTEDGALDRAALAGVVFADDAARNRLNAIVHPRIAARTSALLQAAAPDAIVVHDVPLLVENGMGAAYHLVIVVDAPVDQRVARLVAGRGMSESDARARMAAQATQEARRAAADVWLDNSGSPDQVLAVVDPLWADRLVPFEANVRLGRMPERGGPKLVPYDPDWPAQARRILARLRLAAGAKALRVDHVGSTSVPGLAAKNVIDVQLTVAGMADADALAEPLARAGFPALPDFTRDSPHPPDLDPEHWRKRMAASADPARWANIHLRVAGSPGWRVALLFPDWLRAEPEWAADYLAMKEAVAADYATRDIPSYGDAKMPWFDRALPEMERWAKRTAWRPA